MRTDKVLEGTEKGDRERRKQERNKEEQRMSEWDREHSCSTGQVQVRGQIFILLEIFILSLRAE